MWGDVLGDTAETGSIRKDDLMPSQPKKTRFAEKMAEIAREESGRADATALDFMISRLEGGAVLREVKEELEKALDETCTLEWLRTVTTHLTPDAREKMALARANGAMRHVEDALDIADEQASTAAAVQRNRLRADVRLGIAKMMSPELREAKGSQTNVQIANFGQLLLMAHKAIESGEALPPTDTEIEPATISGGTTAPALPAGEQQTDYEIVPEGGQS